MWNLVALHWIAPAQQIDKQKIFVLDQAEKVFWTEFQDSKLELFRLAIVLFLTIKHIVILLNLVSQ